MKTPCKNIQPKVNQGILSNLLSLFVSDNSDNKVFTDFEKHLKSEKCPLSKLSCLSEIERDNLLSELNINSSWILDIPKKFIMDALYNNVVLGDLADPNDKKDIMQLHLFVDYLDSISQEGINNVESPESMIAWLDVAIKSTWIDTVKSFKKQEDSEDLMQILSTLESQSDRAKADTSQRKKEFVTNFLKQGIEAANRLGSKYSNGDELLFGKEV